MTASPVKAWIMQFMMFWQDFLKVAKSYDIIKATLINYVMKVNAGKILDNLLNISLGRQSILILENYKN